jgi:hypothetical protein
MFREEVLLLPIGPSTFTVTEFVQEPPVEQPDWEPLFQTSNGREFIELREQFPPMQAVPICPAQGQPGAFGSPAFPSTAREPLQS